MDFSLTAHSGDVKDEGTLFSLGNLNVTYGYILAFTSPVMLNVIL